MEWSYDLLHGDEKTLLQQLAVHRGGASLASLVAVAATHGLNEATVAYLVSALVDKSIVSAVVRGRRRPVRHARHRPRVRARASRRERRARRRARRPRRILRGTRRRGARRAARAGMAGAGRRRLELENDNLWAALAYARDAPDPASRLGSARSGGTSRWRERVSEGRRFLDLVLSACAATTRRSSCGSSCSPSSASSRPKSSISTLQLAAGERALSLADDRGGAEPARASRN